MANLEQEGQSLDIKISTSNYNRQHPMAYDENGERYDPLVRDIAKYRTLFTDPQTIDDEYIKALPLSVGLLRSFAVVELGMENAHIYFQNLEREHGRGSITDIFTYTEAVNEMKKMIQSKKTRNQFPFGDGPGNPPAGSARAVMER